MREEKQIRAAFSGLNPGAEQKERMWRKISGTDQAKRRGKSRLRPAVRAAAVIVIVLAAGFGFDVISGGKMTVAVEAATGSHFLSDLRQWIGLDPVSTDIVEKAVDEEIQGSVSVYAPEVLYIDEDLLVFGTRRGLLLYDRKQQELAATVDLQEIGGIYFNSDTKETCVLMREEGLVIFNLENGEPMGSASVCRLSGADEAKLDVSKEITDKDELSELAAAWKNRREEDYSDTFDTLQDAWFINSSDDIQYSEYTCRWTDEDGGVHLSCLVYSGTDEEYVLGIWDEKGTLETKETLNLTVTGGTEEETESEELPAYVYAGEDPVMAALCEYLIEDEEEAGYDGRLIPAPHELARVEEGGETVVFLHWSVYGYVQNGEILECISGGENAIKVRLKKDGDTMKVINVDRAGDGSQYDEDIRAFTKGYSGVYDKFFEDCDDEEEEIRKEWISDYVRRNNLNIRYYKDFGWDPVELEG